MANQILHVIKYNGIFLSVGWTFGSAAITGLLYQPQMIGDGDCEENWWNEDWQGKSKISEKTCPSAILSTTNPTRLDPGLNPGRRGGKPATNRLNYGAFNNRYVKFHREI
jgi:hypothetical protein